MVSITTAVILGQDLSSLVFLAPHGEPSGGFGNEDGAEEDEERRNKLEAHGETEGEGAVVLGRGICDSGGENGTGIED